MGGEAPLEQLVEPAWEGVGWWLGRPGNEGGGGPCVVWCGGWRICHRQKGKERGDDAGLPGCWDPVCDRVGAGRGCHVL